MLMVAADVRGTGRICLGCCTADTDCVVRLRVQGDLEMEWRDG
jgi:hypothetical protein